MCLCSVFEVGDGEWIRTDPDEETNRRMKNLEWHETGAGERNQQ